MQNGPVQRMRRRRRLERRKRRAEQVWVALSGAVKCYTCQTYQVSGRMVDGVLFCDGCDSTHHFVWPTRVQEWHAP